MPDYGKRTGRDAFESLERRLAAAERELRRGGSVSSFDRGNTLTQPAPVEGQTIIQYDTDEPWYYANGAWRDFCCPVTSGEPFTPLDETIAAMVGLDAFWKLNETSGLVAADSSGNGYDLHGASSPPQEMPTWGSDIGPPGETSAYFFGSPATARVLSGSGPPAVPQLADDVTLLGWAKGEGYIGGYGVVQRGSASAGWGVSIFNTRKVRLFVSPLGTTSTMDSDTTVTVGDWVMVAVRRAAGTWTLFLDGVAQSSHLTTTPDMHINSFQLGNDNYNVPSADAGFFGNLSYFALFSRALTDAEIADLDTVAAGPTSELYGKALTADGVGGTVWRYPVGVWINGA